MALREPGDPSIIYDPDYTALAFRGRNLSLCKLQSGLNKLIEDTWARLLALSGDRKIPVERPPSMSEDVCSTGIGDSFIDHVRTEPPTLPLLFEMSRMPGLSLLRPSNRVDDEVSFEVDPSACQEFLHAIKPIVEAISFLVHVTGSGPLRLTEVVDDRYRNGSAPRNLYISHGFVFFLRRNLKTSAVRGCRSSVIHFPPQKVSELLEYYLAVVRPVEVFLTASLGWADEHSNYSQFLHVVKGRKLKPQELSRIVSKLSDQYFGCKLTGSQVRHVLISIQRVFLPPIVDPSVQRFRDTQAGHSSNVANRVYGQRIYHLPGEEETLFALAYDWCKRFHSVIGLGPEVPPVRPIPHFLAPSERGWPHAPGSLPSQPPTQEIMVQVHHAISSALSFAVQELSMRHEKTIKESIFRAIAALSAGGFPNLPVAVRPPSPTLDPASAPLSNYDVSFQRSFPPLSNPSPSS